MVRTLALALLASAALLYLPWGGQVIALLLSDVVLDNPAPGWVSDIPDNAALKNGFMDYL